MEESRPSADRTSQPADSLEEVPSWKGDPELIALTPAPVIERAAGQGEDTGGVEASVHVVDPDRGLFLALWTASLVGTLAVLPFSASLIAQAKEQAVSGRPLSLLLAASVFVELAISAVAILVGIAAGSRVRLGVPLLRAWLAGGPEASRRVRASVGPALGIGSVLGLLIAGLAWRLDPEMPLPDHALVLPAAWEGLLASIGAGIREEIWLRLGAMTVLVWVGTVMIRPFLGERGQPPAAIVWIANLLAALIFAALHIPQAQLLFGLSLPLLIFIFIGNGLPGLVFGWLYWRRGLIAAMIAHFGFDVVLKVFMPLVA